MRTEPSVNPARQFVYLPIVVNACDGADVRRIMAQTCGTGLGSIRVEAIRKSQQSRIWLCIQATMLGLAIHALVVNLPQAEIGHVSRHRVDEVRDGARA